MGGTAMLRRSALMATTAILPTLARPTATTDRRGSTAVFLSGLVPGIAATDMDTAAFTAIALVMAMVTDDPAMAMDDPVTDMHALVTVAATVASWEAAAATVGADTAAAAVPADSTAVVVVDSTAVAVADSMAVADTGKLSGVDQY